MRFGTSYYPEITEESEWRQDLENMREACMSILRIGEFAWSALEPREGCYDFAWLDRFLDLAHSLDFKVVLCTPTATPPAWMTSQYPEMLIQRRDGSRHVHGGRRHGDVDNEVYRFFSAQIAGALGKRYGTHPAVIGWQIDNELIGPEGEPPESHSQATTFRFRQYLKNIHGTLAILNQRWGTRFWSQQYSDWGEVTTPLSHRSTMGQVLDYSRYFSESIRDFIQLQYRALRETIAPGQWISTNSTAVFDRGHDHQDWADVLDVSGWDAYLGAAGRPHPEAFTALAHDLFRSAKLKPFWVFETNPIDSQTTPALVAEMLAHGAAGMIIWHWRNHQANAENESDTFCDCAGTPDPNRVQFMQQLAARREIQVENPESLPRRKAAFLFCPDCVRTNLTPDQYMQHGVSNRISYLRVVIETYKTLWQAGIAVDVVRPGADLSGYKLLVMPSSRLLSEQAAGDIRRFVQEGGTLLGVAKTMHQDQWGAYYSSPGGPLADVLGFTMSRNLNLPADTPTIHARLGDQQYACLPHLDLVTPTTAQELGQFIDGPAEGQPAALLNQFGKGNVYYAAACSGEMIADLAQRAAKTAGVAYWETFGENVAILPDCSGQTVWVFNHSGACIQVKDRSVSPGEFVQMRTLR